MASGRANKASSVNRYAHHIVPTITVIFRPNLALKRTIQFSCLTPRISAVVNGFLLCNSAARGWRTYS